jgi:hypothetical protein
MQKRSRCVAFASQGPLLNWGARQPFATYDQRRMCHPCADVNVLPMCRNTQTRNNPPWNRRRGSLQKNKWRALDLALRAFFLG